MKSTVLGIDLAKNVFQLHGVDDQGNVMVRKKLTRPKLLPFVAQLPPCRIGMEAC
jgi:transposase